MRRGRESTLWDSMIKKVISRKSLNDCELVEGREEALKYSTKAFLNLFTGLNDFRTRMRKFKVIIDESFLRKLEQHHRRRSSNDVCGLLFLLFLINY